MSDIMLLELVGRRGEGSVFVRVAIAFSFLGLLIVIYSHDCKGKISSQSKSNQPNPLPANRRDYSTIDWLITG